MSSQDHSKHGGKTKPKGEGATSANQKKKASKPSPGKAQTEMEMKKDEHAPPDSPGSGLSHNHSSGTGSKASIGGHPIHPALVSFPIAFLLGAFASDLLYLGLKAEFWAQASFWLLVGGALTGFAAALAGTVDLLGIEHARKFRLAWIHAFGNAIVLSLVIANIFLRRSDAAGAILPFGLVLSALTSALISLTGWIGGELVFRHGIGVSKSVGGDHSNPDDHRSAGQPPAGMKMDRPAPGNDAPGSQKKMDMAGGGGMKGMDQAGMKMDIGPAMRATTMQKISWAVLSVVALLAGVTYSATTTNLRLGPRDVGGAVMPPGMIMLRDTPGGAMRDMAAVDPRTVSYTAPADARGDQTLEPRIENGVKVFNLTTSVIKWNILPDKQVMAYAFNQQVPGPRIRATEGDRIRINVTNNLPDSTTVHWHGLILPNNMDGAANITQSPIEPGQTFTYEFTTQQAGTYFYHTHDNADRQQTLGLYGALIIDPKDASKVPAYDLEYTIQLQEWLAREGYTYPAMLMEGGLPNYFTINGKAYPSTDTIQMKVGQKIRLRFIGSNSNFTHPMHVHGGPFKIIETDGNPVAESAQIEKDTVNVAPGERYDVIWTAREPGKWLIHCHILHHTTNNNVEEQGGGGLTMLINVVP